jgi:hypothetical protein
MNRIDAELEGRGWRKVASGTWFYDRTAPMTASIWAAPAHLLRVDECGQFDETVPVPENLDGFLYFCWPNNDGPYLTAEAAKAAADAKPWGPFRWHQNSN